MRNTAVPAQPHPCTCDIARLAPDTLCVSLRGAWTLQAPRPTAHHLHPQLTSLPAVRRLVFETQDLTAWDSGLLTFLLALHALCVGQQIDMILAGLPQGAQRLMALATAVPERQDARRQAVRDGFVVRLGKGAFALLDATRAVLAFVGEAALALGQLLRGRARFRRVDLLLIVQACGVQALPIVSLISFLVGLILAFVGATQLQPFGAQVYVANLVGIGMAREMGAMMTGIIMAGRTGAAFAAQLGTMTVNQEIDALKTMGVNPMEFLVLPRLLALVLMVPLLCIYADLVGILGGACVGIVGLQIIPSQYYQYTMKALHLHDFAMGLVKGGVFGVIVALAGCLRGMQCGRNASAVGTAATSAVVTGIVWIVIWDAILTVLYAVLGI